VIGMLVVVPVVNVCVLAGDVITLVSVEVVGMLVVVVKIEV
jgi:hypothetical protein